MNNRIAIGQVYGATDAIMYWPFPVPMRIVPTGITISSAAHFLITDSTFVNKTLTGLTFSVAQLQCCTLGANVSGGGLTAGAATIMSAQNASASISFDGAEL